MSRLEEAILDVLATYHYLTAEQLLRLGVSKNLRHIRQVLADMSGRVYKKDRRRPLNDNSPPLVDYIDIGREFGGRVHLYWHLPDETKGFKPTQHLHLRSVVDLHITVMQWAARNLHRVE